MTDDIRTKAEKFVTKFIDYMQNTDILDEFDNRTQKMTRSPGVDSLYREAQDVFPARKPKGESAKEMRELSDTDRDEAVSASTNVIDTRELFALRVALNGGVRRLLREVLEGKAEAVQEAFEFFKAEDGKKEFAKE